MIRLHTPRLQLVALDIPHMQLLITDRPEMERRMGLERSDMRIEPLYRLELEKDMPGFTKKAEAHPDDYPWFSAWEMVHTETNVSIGGIGFAGPPDAEGKVLFGYHVDGNHHNKGFATEAIKAMTDWAFGDERTHTIVATVLRDNFPSQQVLLKNGFMPTGKVEQEGMLLYVFQKSRS